MALVQQLTAAQAKSFTLSNGAASWDRVTLSAPWRYLYVYNRQATNPYWVKFTLDGTTPGDVSSAGMDDALPVPPNTLVCLAVNESGFGPANADPIVHILVGAFATQNVTVFTTLVPFVKGN